MARCWGLGLATVRWSQLASTSEMSQHSRKPLSAVAIQLRCGQWLKPRPSGERIGMPPAPGFDGSRGCSARLLQLFGGLNSANRGPGGAGTTFSWFACETVSARTGSVLASQRVSPKPGFPFGFPSPGIPR